MCKMWLLTYFRSGIIGSSVLQNLIIIGDNVMVGGGGEGPMLA